MLKTLRCFLPLLGGLLLASCSDDDGGNGPNPSVAVSLGGPITVVQGQTGTTQVTVTRGGGFDGAVTLAATGLPTGVTASFDPASVPAGSGNGTSTLTLTAAANAATGAATFSVTATGGANLTATTNASVTVNAAPDFSLAVAPTTLSVQQGAAQTANITITRTGGFAGAVNLSVANLPIGVTAGFDNAAPTGNAAILTLTADAGAALETTNLTIEGVGTPGTRSAALALTVTEPPSGFTLAANPSTVSIEQGLNGTSVITISKTGTFTGPVALSVTGLPADVTAVFDPASASPGVEGAQDVQTTSTLTLTVGEAVAAQNYPLVIHGQAEGEPEATLDLTLTVTPAPVNGFTIAVNPATVTVVAGETGQSTVTISKTGTFTDNVTLSVTNLPTGVTAAFDPAAASASKAADVQTTSTLTLTVAPDVAPLDYELTVRGAAEGQPDSDVTLTLTVTGAAGDYTLAVNPSTVSIPAGQSGNAMVTISKTGSFTGNVTLSAVGLPANVTATFNPPAASPPRASAARDVETISTMTLTVGGGVAQNNYPFQVKGVAEGEEDKLVNVTLTVPAPPGSGNANIKYCDLDNLPIWFASKDGNGPWTQVTGVVAGDGTTYSFNITQSTGAFAVVTGSASTGYETSVTYGTQAQLIGNNGQCPTAPFTRTLNGSVSGLGATDQVIIAMGGSGANANSAQPNFQLERVLDGPSDLLAVRNEIVLTPFSLVPAGIILRRNLNIANGGTIPVLNFAAAEAFAPATAAFTFTGAGSDNVVASMIYVTPTTSGSISNAITPVSPVTLHGIPADKQEANDLHQLAVLASTNTGDARGHFQWFKTLAPKNVDLGEGLTPPTVTSLGNAPYPRYQSTGPIQALYDDAFGFQIFQQGGTDADDRSWAIFVFRGFFPGATYTMAMEDMTSAGYQAAWGLKVGVPASHQTQGVGYSNNGISNPTIEGGFADFASRIGQVTP